MPHSLSPGQHRLQLEHENHLPMELRYCIWSISYTSILSLKSVILLKLTQDGFLTPTILTNTLTRLCLKSALRIYKSLFLPSHSIVFSSSLLAQIFFNFPSCLLYDTSFLFSPLKVAYLLQYEEMFLFSPSVVSSKQSGCTILRHFREKKEMKSYSCQSILAKNQSYVEEENASHSTLKYT